MAHSLTPDERKELKQIIKTKGSDHSRKINPDDCQRIRERYIAGESIGDMLDEFEAIKETLHKHLRNDCECSNGENNIETTGGNPSRIKCPYKHCKAHYGTYDKLTSHINCQHK